MIAPPRSKTAARATESRIILGPFNRVEGDLEVRLDVANGKVARAEVNATMFRGFECMLLGRDPMDALTIVPRICGICSVSQSIAAARALGDAWGVTLPRNGQIAQNLMIACENLADHLTHFYLFFMPDFTRDCYSTHAWHGEATRRFAALGEAQPGAHSVAATAARARWFQLMGLLGGKWPHTGAIVPGGSARALEPSELLRIKTRLHEMRSFLERTLYGAPLERFAALTGVDELQRWHQESPTQAQSDMALWLQIAADLSLDRIGTGPTRVMSHGAYPQTLGGHAFAPGIFALDSQTVLPYDHHDVTEDARHAWLDESPQPSHPGRGHTWPTPGKAGAYSWNKAPRWQGRVLEVGAHARQLVDGHALVRALTPPSGAHVLSRVVARLLEISRLLPLMERWVQQLQNKAPYAVQALPAKDAEGVGLTEAARGSLGHWIRIENGRIASYQIIAPTSWNFSPRDSRGLPGALESALVGIAVAQGCSPSEGHIQVQHIVRSFDPCMVCTVH